MQSKIVEPCQHPNDDLGIISVSNRAREKVRGKSMKGSKGESEKWQGGANRYRDSRDLIAE